MAKFGRVITALIGIVSIILIAYVMFKPPGKPAELPEVNPPLSDELNHYITDRMDYRLEFSRVLAQKRIERVKKIAAEHPEYEPKAQVVMDTLRQRLARRAMM